MRLWPAFLGIFLLLAPVPASADALALFNQANEAYRASDFAKTVELCEEALMLPEATGPLRGGIHHVRGAAELRLGQYEAAIADYDKALALFAQADNPKNFADLVSGILWERGLAKAHGRGCEDAIVDYTAALQGSPNDPVMLADRGRCYGLLGQTDKARADFDAALKIDPKNEDATQWKAELK